MIKVGTIVRDSRGKRYVVQRVLKDRFTYYKLNNGKTYGAEAFKKQFKVE